MPVVASTLEAVLVNLAVLALSKMSGLPSRDGASSAASTQNGTCTVSGRRQFSTARLTQSIAGIR
ncbi:MULTISPECIES: hypothetical protein [Bradyrhizobium]|jgi:hypothetical protein|uniref:hypothetical protein n=1 Tax=Bradyrhizobium TaxID=374 RepID=UPI000FBC30B0|nr:hypothetical protein [Bradyrhizobium denitrificans]MCL8484924.1 hypothetical protein [Bradyrhizobium denitrificans]RTL91687.1 MAG: hypothetical protein EKK32_32310 [Bradyrhizobiaceae bacterium]